MDIKKLHTNFSFMVSFLAILGMMLIFILILWLAYLPNRAPSIDYDDISQRKAVLSELQAKANKDLHHYRWINQNKGVVGLPVEHAMKLIIQEYNQSDN